MKKLLVFLFVFSWTFCVKAQQVEDIPPGPDRITAVRQGDTVLYNGQLYDNDTALRWANWLRQYRQLLPVEVKLAQERGRIDLEAEKKLHLIDLQEWETKKQAYEQMVQRLQQGQSAWWHPALWFSFGIAATLVGVTSVVLATR